ncbi:ROK family glucokinase [Arcanobacterium hippocoleae]
MALSIGIDVGGTKIAGGVVDENGEILEMVKIPTPAQDSQASIDAAIKIINDLKTRYHVTAVGIGAPGFINSDRSEVIFAPNVNWRNEPVAAKVAEKTGLPVVLENDANVAAWGEFKFGAAKECSSVVIVTVGTGIGGGIILDGKLIRGSHGFAAEIGHMSLVPDGPLCPCGEYGCWEMYSSGTALVRLAKERAEKSPATAAKLLELVAGDIDAIDGKIIDQAVAAGDSAASDCFAEVGKYLGQGMANLAAALDPEMFVISGGVCNSGDFLLKPVREAFETRVTARSLRPLPEIHLAKLGNLAGLIGAANIAFETEYTA